METFPGEVPREVPMHERSREFMQMLGEAITEPRDVVVDCATATGNS